MNVRARTATLLSRFLDRPNALTAKNYRDALEDFAKFRRMPLEDAVADLIAGGGARANEIVGRYKQAMGGKRDRSGRLLSGRGLGPSTVNLRMTVLRGLVKKARKSGAIDWELDVAGEKPEAVKDNRGPGLDVVRAMLAETAKMPSPERERAGAILRIFAEVGLRRREIIGLDIDDVDFQGRSLNVLGKGRTQKRAVAVSRGTLDAIRRWLNVRPPTPRSRALFVNLIPGRHDRISGASIYLIVRGASDPVVFARGSRKQKRVGPHKLRHFAFTSAAANAQALGLGRAAVQKFTGHRDARSVDPYLDAADGVANRLTDANAALLDKPVHQPPHN